MNDSIDKPEKEESKVDDNAGIKMSGHILIRDADTGEELVNKRNAIHYGNMANMIANALTNTSGAYIHYMAFGNGATSVDSACPQRGGRGKRYPQDLRSQCDVFVLG